MYRIRKWSYWIFYRQKREDLICELEDAEDDLSRLAGGIYGPGEFFRLPISVPIVDGDSKSHASILIRFEIIYGIKRYLYFHDIAILGNLSRIRYVLRSFLSVTP